MIWSKNRTVSPVGVGDKSSGGDVSIPEREVENAVRHAVQFIRALGIRYGFRRRDYSIIWDGGAFVASREVHQLQILVRDGRSFTAPIGDAALVRQDSWKYLREIDAGFGSLARRTELRGV